MILTPLLVPLEQGPIACGQVFAGGNDFALAVGVGCVAYVKESAAPSIRLDQKSVVIGLRFLSGNGVGRNVSGYSRPLRFYQTFAGGPGDDFRFFEVGTCWV